MKLLLIAAVLAVAAADVKELNVARNSYGQPVDPLKGSGTDAQAATAAAPTAIPTGNIHLGTVGNVKYEIDSSSLAGLDPAKLAELNLDLSTVGAEDSELKSLGSVSLAGLLGGALQGASLQGASLQGGALQSAGVQGAGLQGIGLQGGALQGAFQGNFQQQLPAIGSTPATFSNLPILQSTPATFSNLPLLQSTAASLPSLPLIQPTVASFSNLNLADNSAPSVNIGFNNRNNFAQNTDSHSEEGGETDKHLYFYTAPEEPEPAAPRVILPPKPKNNVKVIFVKAPEFKTAPAPVIQPESLQKGEEKTVVYVLVKKPEEPAPIVLPTPPPTKPSKPEVVFIKYKDQKDAEEAVSHIQNTGSSAGLDSGLIGVNSVSGSSVADQRALLNTISQGKNNGLGSFNIQERTGFGVTQSPLDISSISSLNLGGLSSSNGLSGLNFVSDGGLGGFNSFSTTTLSPLIGNGLNFGTTAAPGFAFSTPAPQISINNFPTSTPSPISYSTTGTPGTLFDSFGEEESASSGSFALAPKPHSIYGPPINKKK